ncbi:MAG TPA: filamentous hemagglutinin N-terminal domain-containing protein, partial [Pseudomonadales bacterium]
MAQLAFGAPQGGEVTAGDGTIETAGTTLTVNQASEKLALNWQSFNIGADESVVFAQPSSSSIALNRILGHDPSVILGNLTANGQVFLLNPNGVLFGAAATVDVGGLLASTLSLSNEDFLAGRYRLYADESGSGEVINAGTLTAHDGGYVALA